MKPSSTSRFDWAVVFFSGWFITGLYLDGWAHNHVPDLETFFTPWHGVLYSGFLALTLFLSVSALRQRMLKKKWSECLPAGYLWSLVGSGIFLLGGVGDLVWHEIFGIEGNVDALLSPTHLVLAVGGVLMLLGPARAYWYAKQKKQAVGLSKAWAAVFSLVFTFSILTFMGQFAHPAHVLAEGVIPADIELAHRTMSLGVSSIILTTITLMGSLLLFYRSAKFPFGGFTFFFGLNALLMGYMRDSLYLVPAALIAGFMIDLLARHLRLETLAPRAIRCFAFFTPVIAWSAYFITLLVHRNIWWSVHLWTGSIVMSGLIGLMLSYVFQGSPEEA